MTAFAADSLRVRENEDNSAVIRAAQDALRLIQNKLLPAACSWVQVGPWVRVFSWVRAGPWVWMFSWVWMFWVREGPWPGRAPQSGQALGPDGLHGLTEGAGLTLGVERVPGLESDAVSSQLFTRAGTHGGHLEGAIHLKAELETALKRSRELDIAPEEGRRGEVSAPNWL